MNISNIQQLDADHIWHPCSQMKDYEEFKPLVIQRAYDCYLELTDGRKIIDAISSWWCKSLGHNHPEIKKVVLQQIEQFEHVIFANTTNEKIVELSQQLAELLPGLNKVFYAGDGSCAVEIALKMSLHARVIQGETQRNQFIALKNGYHGETIGALSVSDLGLYRDPYQSILFKTHFIQPPYVDNTNESLWDDAESYWQQIEKSLEPYSETATAIIFEPIVQGAGGMRIYSQDFLARLARWAKQHNVHLIADEIMTGIGRTGKMLACEHANIIPDFVCVSKGLTSGWLPLSAVITTDIIYQIFYDDYETGKAFLHSQTYCGNALAVSAALATLSIIKQQNLISRANQLQKKMMQDMQQIALETGRLTNIRGIGAIVAADLIAAEGQKRLGYQVFRRAVELGAWLRPLGNTIYWLPPLIIKPELMEELKQITFEAIRSI